MKKAIKLKMPELKLKYNKGSVEAFKVTSSDSAADALRKMFDSDTLEYREEFIALFLSRANETIGWFKVGTGGVAGVVADPKLIFSAALLSGASAIVLAHNHPSGITKPSSADIRMTERLRDGALLLDMSVLDHIIVTKENHYSFADEGKL